MPDININYGQVVGGVLGAGGGIAAGIGALGAATTTLGAATAITGIGAAVVGLVTLLLKFFHGADPNEAIAANIQQIFEVAVVNVEALAGGAGGQWGSSPANPPLISKEECLQAIASFKQAAQQYEEQGAQQTHDPKPFQDGMDACINEFDNSTAAVTQSFPEITVSGAINFSACHQHYVPVGHPGFMKAGQYGNPNIVDSINAGAQVTDTFLQSLPRTLPNIVSNAASTVAGAVAGAVGQISGLTPALTPTGTPSGPAQAMALQSAITAHPVATVVVVVLAILCLRWILT